jgi:hypothetical protein
MQIHKKFGRQPKEGVVHGPNPCTHCRLLSMPKILPWSPQDPSPRPSKPSKTPPLQLGAKNMGRFGLLFSLCSIRPRQYQTKCWLVWHCTVTVLDKFIIFKLFLGIFFVHAARPNHVQYILKKDAGSRQSDFQEHLSFETSLSNSSKMGPRISPCPLFRQVSPAPSLDRAAKFCT